MNNACTLIHIHTHPHTYIHTHTYPTIYGCGIEICKMHKCEYLCKNVWYAYTHTSHQTIHNQPGLFLFSQQPDFRFER